jgi:predicted membrane channel-forming protein YqfA (hemolysin III family)
MCVVRCPVVVFFLSSSGLTAFYRAGHYAASAISLGFWMHQIMFVARESPFRVFVFVSLARTALTPLHTLQTTLDTWRSPATASGTMP